jgi:long-chain acyl-CoA synthetase
MNDTNRVMPDPGDLSACIAHSVATAMGNAIEFEEAWWSWDDVRAVHATLRMLLADKLADTSLPVGIAIRNRPAHVAAFWSLMAMGRPAAFVNAFRPVEAIAEEVSRLGLHALIADADDWVSPVLNAVARDAGVLGVALGHEVSSAVGLVPGLEAIGPGPHRTALPGVAVEMLTSGTSGEPKRVPLGYQSLGFAVYERQAVLSAKMGEAPADDLPAATLIQYGPIVHLGGLFTAVQCGMQARPLVLLEKFDVQPHGTLRQRHARRRNAHSIRAALWHPGAEHIRCYRILRPDCQLDAAGRQAVWRREA